MSNHFDGRRFFNPEASTGKSLWEILRWILTRRRQPWPRWVEPEDRPEEPVCQLPPEQTAVTFVNHSTFLIRLGGFTLLTDPIWSTRASPVSWVGPRRVRAPGIPFDRLPRVDVVLVSHSHYDHMDLPTLRRLQQRFEPLFLTGLGNRRLLQRAGMKQVEELSWWQTHGVSDRLTVTFTPAQHFSRRGLLDMNRSLWGSFVLEADRFRLFFAGDTGYGSHFRQIRERLGPMQAGLIPIGAFEPRWFMKVNHMNPAEAVQAHLDLELDLSIAMHFGTFQLTDEAIDEPIKALARALAERGIPPEQFRVPAFGEQLALPVAGN